MIRIPFVLLLVSSPSAATSRSPCPCTGSSARVQPATGIRHLRTVRPRSVPLGAFTGEGTTKPGLSCDKPTKAVASARDFSRAGGRHAARRHAHAPEDATKPVPLVALIHGYAGSKTSSGDLVPPLLAEGYAVLRYSTRGFGESWGQVNMVDVHAEVADLRSMIAQVVDEPRFSSECRTPWR